MNTFFLNTTCALPGSFALRFRPPTPSLHLRLPSTWNHSGVFESWRLTWFCQGSLLVAWPGADYSTSEPQVLCVIDLLSRLFWLFTEWWTCGFSPLPWQPGWWCPGDTCSCLILELGEEGLDRAWALWKPGCQIWGLDRGYRQKLGGN